MYKYFQFGAIKNPVVSNAEEINAANIFDITDKPELHKLSHDEIALALGLLQEPVFNIDEAKQAKIKALHDAFNQEREEYLTQYPQWEIDTFEARQKEVNAYDQDNAVPTPIIDAMVGGDPTLRIEMINAVREKMLYLAQKTGQVVAIRDAIKRCTTKEELEAIQW